MMPDTTIPIPLLRGPVQLSHLMLETFVREGSRSIDATCGNGHDTLLLARLAGDTGHVWAFDIQERAVLETRRKLDESDLAQRVNLVHSSHEYLAEHVSAPVDAVIFNLGYLPGGDRSIITRPETTLLAFDQALELLAPGGILIAVIYPGHPGGSGEESAVETWAGRLAPGSFHVWRLGQMNTPQNAPYLNLIQKVN